MKKAMKVVAFAATACIVLSSAVSAFAAELTIVEKSLVNPNNKMIIGTYPEITGSIYDAVNKTIFDTVWKGWTLYATDPATANAKNVYNTKYDGVTYAGDIAKLTITMDFKQSRLAKGELVQTNDWYVDVKTGKASTAAAYAAAEAAAKEETKPTVTTTGTIEAGVEGRMVKFNKLAKFTEYQYSFDASSGSLVINDKDGKYVTILVVGTNSYFKNGTAVSLSSAPTAVDDAAGFSTVYVPAEFFSTILDFNVKALGTKDIVLSK